MAARMKCDYISDHVGDIYTGVITGVTKFGLFVELDDVFVEGLVHVSTLVGDYFHYDQASQRLAGGRTGTSYSLADLVSVQVARVDVDERKVDFELVTHSPQSPRRFRAKDKRARKKGRMNGRGSLRNKNKKKNQRRR